MSGQGARVVASSCPLDCPDACSLQVTVEADRITKIDGGHANPLTGGYICAKVRRYPEHLYGPHRLLAPGIRRGRKGEGLFASVSWDEALGLVAERMARVRQEFGGEAILPFSYGGSNGFLSQDTTDARLFRRLGACRLARTVCAAPSGRAAQGLYGKMAGVALQDYVHARLIVVWGANPSVSGIHLVPLIQKAQQQGARLVVVDPRRTPLARRADLHLAPRPGTDLPLALALVAWLFERGAADRAFLAAHAAEVEELRRRAEPWTIARAAETAGVPPADLEALARLYAASSPAVVRCGWGLERNRNGGSAVAAILALPAVGGKFRVRGGGYTMSNSGAWTLSSTVAAREPERTTRLVNMNLLGETLLSDPPIRLLFVYNCNPLATMPRQERVREGLGREDLFTVVFDQVRTDTAKYADVVLPATTFLERRELARSYGALVLQDSPAVVSPYGLARSNHEVFAELTRRMGLAQAGEPETAEELVAEILRGDPREGEIRSSLRQTGVAFPEGGPTPVQFVDVFPRTPDGKVHLVPEELDREAPQGLYAFRPDPATERFPLALISPATDRTISSSLGELSSRHVSLELHPADAEARSILAGDAVRIFNALGEVRCQARLSPDLRPGTVLIPKGLWSHHTASGSTANALAPDTLSDLGGGACFNDARVQVERL